ARLAHRAPCGNQLGGIHLVDDAAGQSVYHRNTASANTINSGNQTAALQRQGTAGMLDDLFEYPRRQLQVHGKIFPGFKILFGSSACLMRFIASMAADCSASGRNSDFMMPIPCSPEM